MSATYDFTGKSIIVTGAGNGIGKTIVEKLVGYGANVIALSLLQTELDDLLHEFPQVKAIQVDVADWNGVRNVLENLEPIDGLVNNAGIARTNPFMSVTQEDFDTSFDVNVKAIVNVSQIVAKNMLDNNIKGAIVNVSSVASKTAILGGSVYCATKAAVQSLTGSMALELGGQGIRVNSVLPTFVKTNLARSIWEDESKAKKYTDMTPMKRFAEKEEVADGVVFLLSDQASMVNGAGLPVDGGFLV